MGLFGYGKKEYCENAERFMGELKEVDKKLSAKGLPADELPRNVLKEAIRALENMSSEWAYPKDADRKALKLIDERIQTTIGKIVADVDGGEGFVAREYIDILYGDVVFARREGREYYSPETLRLAQEKAEYVRSILMTIRRKREAEEKANKLIEDSRELPRDSEQFRKNREQFNELREEQSDLDKYREELTRAYEAHAKYLFERRRR